MDSWINYNQAAQAVLLLGFCYCALPLALCGYIRPRPVWAQDGIIVLNFTFFLSIIPLLIGTCWLLVRLISGATVWSGPLPLFQVLGLRLLELILGIGFLWPNYRSSPGLSLLALFLVQWGNLYFWLRGAPFSFDVSPWGYMKELPSKPIAFLVYVLLFAISYALLRRYGWLTRDLMRRSAEREVEQLLKGSEQHPL